MLNHIDIQGRLTNEPELRYTQSQSPVATFRLACDRDFVDRSTGERGVDFIPVVAWKNVAEFVSKYFRKGSLAVVSGRLQVREYNDKDGNKRSVTEVIANSVYFCERREPKEQIGGKPTFTDEIGEEGEIPF